MRSEKKCGSTTLDLADARQNNNNNGRAKREHMECRESKEFHDANSSRSPSVVLAIQPTNPRPKVQQ